MDSIRINTNEKRIAINDDPGRVIVFDPTDVTFAERFYSLIKEFEDKLHEYEARAEEIDRNTAIDHNQLPVNLADKLTLMREACEFMRGRIDHLFGEGTSQTVFGNAMTLDMFKQFFTGITPFVKTARVEKVKQYSRNAQKRSGRAMGK